ncbi:unnamed protein product, partial [Hapterophycus canaliculatus]
LHVPNAPPGGRVEPRTRRGLLNTAEKTTRSRPIGEMFMEGEEPAQSTAAQRCWVYSHDPVIKYHREGVPVAPSPGGLSLDGGTGPRATTSARGRN